MDNIYLIGTKKYKVSDTEILDYIVNLTGVTRSESVKDMTEHTYLELKEEN